MAPMKPRQPCNIPMCSRLAVKRGRCELHYKPWDGKTWASGGYNSPEWQRVRRQVLAEEPVCRICGVAPAIIVDHIQGKAFSGTDDRENLRGVCKPCHDRETARQASARRWGKG